MADRITRPHPTAKRRHDPVDSEIGDEATRGEPDQANVAGEWVDAATATTAELPRTPDIDAASRDDAAPAAPEQVGSVATRGRRLAARWNPTTGVWIGLGLAAAGFVTIFYSWSKVAGLVIVAQQVPFLVSGGLSGVALVIVGVTALGVAVRREDRRDRTDQLVQITRLLDSLHELLDETDEPAAADTAEHAT